MLVLWPDDIELHQFPVAVRGIVCRHGGRGCFQLTTHCGRLILLNTPLSALTAWTDQRGEGYCPLFLCLLSFEPKCEALFS